MENLKTRVVVVNYNGGEQTLECLQALVADDPNRELDIVLVDNASNDHLVQRMPTELPSVRVIPSKTNLGFGGGNNLALADLSGIDFVALINSDARVQPGWLAPLKNALLSNPALGAACPRIRLAGEFITVDISAHRPLTVAGAWVDGQDVSARVQYGPTFGAPEPPTPEVSRARRLKNAGQIWVPVNSATETISLRVLDGGPAIFSADRAAVSSERHRSLRTVEVPVGPPRMRLLNNTGNYWTRDGFSADRGWLEPDELSRYAVSEPVEAWCGAAVLLRADCWLATGNFDEKLFLYYEDADLSERAKNLGWSFIYVPESLVDHDHATSTGEDSLLALRLTERNRLTVIRRYQRGGVKAVMKSLIATLGYARRDLFTRPLRWRLPRSKIVSARLRAVSGSISAKLSPKSKDQNN